MSNLQTNNVANLGDILKHASLVSIIEYLLLNMDNTQDSFTWIDFHTFQLSSDINSSRKEEWDLICQQWLKNSKGFDNYYNLEKQIVTEHGHYLCSSGIVTKILTDLCAGLENYYMILSENNETTRELLKKQVEVASAMNSFSHYTIMENSLALDKYIKTPKTSQTLFALIDPFQLTVEEWTGVTTSLEKCFPCPKSAVILAFSYDKNGGDKVQWKYFKEPKDFHRLATISRENYTLCVYCTKDLVVSIGKILQDLQWDLISFE